MIHSRVGHTVNPNMQRLLEEWLCVFFPAVVSFDGFVQHKFLLSVVVQDFLHHPVQQDLLLAG